MSHSREMPPQPAEDYPLPHGSPIDTEGPRVAMYTQEFADDPHRVYADMRRRFGSLVPVELAPGIAATLVIGYRTAVQILNDPAHFPADPRNWQRKVPEDSPIRPMMEWRPNALRSAGIDHDRYRSANTASIGAVDRHAMHSVVEDIAVPLINAFCGAGQADLLQQYVYPLVFQTLNTMLGCDPDIGEQVAAGMAAIFDTVDADRGNKLLSTALQEHTDRKRAAPGDDITSRLIAHATELTDEEMIHQLVTLYGAGIEPQVHLVSNTLLLMLTDDRFGGDMLGGSLSTRDALDEVLFTNPPLANYCISYPRQPILIDGVWLPADQPVVISMAACNNDPAVHSDTVAGNRSHLAWSVGPHTCPARHLGYQIAQDAIDQLLDALPEVRLAIPATELSWRPGPFHRALSSLPVLFPPSPPLTV
ncbi:cytochrome P450 [Nocardia transvalensis]|uniref:Cytochrome P450 n=1 Tax=Nocardia transvalensis TaxID=37333 RepID=A0A7W9P9J1_9NOCA|nr:cytochrome P450 [Nocardia transvalensis]MBB5911937.1 cytochrome P450 [Nocardia transvalensis]